MHTYKKIITFIKLELESFHSKVHKSPIKQPFILNTIKEFIIQTKMRNFGSIMFVHYLHTQNVHSQWPKCVWESP